MRTIYLFRHGQTLWNAQRRYIGSTDQSLSPEGRAVLAGRAGPPVDRLWVSPLRRCRETAAMLYPGMEQQAVEKKIDATRKRFDKKNESQHPVITEQDIAEVVSAWTKIPVSKLEESDTQRLNKLEKELHRRVIGQDEAVSAVSEAILRGRAGLKEHSIEHGEQTDHEGKLQKGWNQENRI